MIQLNRKTPETIKEEKAIKTVYCLYRVSTKGQVDKDDIPMQKQECREFAERQSGFLPTAFTLIKSSTSKTREITIVYNFIGAFDFSRAIEEARHSNQKQQETA